MPKGHVLGVDGGGSATRSVIMSTEGEVLATAKGGPSNPITIGAERALANILEAVDEASARCGVHEFLASRLGVAGTDRSRLRQELLDGMRQSFGDTAIVSDAASALAGGTGCRPGVVVIAGTGSIAYGENRLGETARAGGWGWRLGDEGSGYTIGVKAIIAALRAHDGRGPETVLKQKIVSHLGLGGMEDIIDWVYEPGREPRDVAYLVPLVREAEAEGDEAAALVMAEAGAELGFVANAVIRRLGMSGEFPVSLNGGVFKQPSVYIIAFEEVVRREASECALIKPRMPPLLGSGLLALKSLGVTIDEALLQRVEKSYRGLGEADE
ncbi:MAG TPA: BadF/BadG/BcrA/BcrD ATPase family protein [Candidatus Krumholzibacteriaceae bacterium]|nr:BadF/BadG/BcrA/BcrD ATPase family protein [Candidatus Krumholzibacteriaceae bacterium]